MTVTRFDMTPARFGGKNYGRAAVQPIGDDADIFASYGHIDREAMAEAVARCYEEIVGPLSDLSEPITADDVRHVYAAEEGTRGQEEWRISWRGVTADAPGAFPITLVSV